MFKYNLCKRFSLERIFQTKGTRLKEKIYANMHSYTVFFSEKSLKITIFSSLEKNTKTSLSKMRLPQCDEAESCLVARAIAFCAQRRVAADWRRIAV